MNNTFRKNRMFGGRNNRVGGDGVAMMDVVNSAMRHGLAKLFAFRASSRWSYWVVLSLVCAAIVVTAAQSYRAIDQELTEVALSRRAAVAQLAATTLSEKFARLVDVGVSLATRVRFRELVAGGRWEEASGILREVPRDLPFIERLFLTDVEGTLRADVPQLPGVRGVNFAYREWYQGVRRDWRPYVSPVYQRAAKPRLDVFAVAVPIKKTGGDAAGILVLQLRTDTFFAWARGFEVAPEEFVYVVDAKGQVAFHSKLPVQVGIIDYSGAPAVQRLQRGERGVEIAVDPYAREEVVSSYAPAAAHGWGVVTQQPARAAFAAKDQQLRRLLWAYGATLAFFIVVIYLASRIVVERRQAEEDRRVRAELERRVAERTVQLEAANQELESFSYSVSHDLRTPLRAIDGFSRILGEDYNERLDGEGRRLLRVIRDNSRQMGQLIDDLLAFSRLGRKPLAVTEIDMTALAQRVFEELQAGSGGRATALRLSPLPAATGDPTLIRQAWVNLLSNAIKFSGQRADPVIEVSGNEDGHSRVYCVRDNGAGFDMQYYDKLFRVFQRLHSADQFPGTGVGLAIVQRVIARHGGRVWAEGKVGEGAAFYFALPGGEGTDG